MNTHARMVVTILTVVFILLSVALVSDESGENRQLLGRAVLPMKVTITPVPQYCQDFMWGKTIYRRCE